MLTVGSLFAGIGGFDLGLERVGMKVIWQSEIDPFASAVLKKHWPHVPNHGDIRTIRSGNVERPDVLCGGFPCQDISNAGKRAGIDGERSGLWSEYARVIGELRPDYVIVENVAALLGRGLARVLGDLAALGFDAEWHCIPASAVGAPHRRDRLWIVAYAGGVESGRIDRDVDGSPSSRESKGTEWQRLRCAAGYGGAHVADADRTERRPLTEGRNVANGHDSRRQEAASGLAACSTDGSDPNGARLSPSWPQPYGTNWIDSGRVLAASDWWGTEPDVGRVAHGIPSRVDRLRCLGNAIVPQIAEIIGRAIIEATRSGRVSG